MALIAREELQIDCRLAGHTVVHEVLASGPDISNDRMDELFEPLVSSIEERTRDAVEREIDEYRGQREEQDEDAARQSIIDQRKADLEEGFQVYLMVNAPGQSPSPTSSESESESEPNWEWNSNWEYVSCSWESRLPTKNTDHISVRKVPPRNNVDDLSDEDIMDQSYDNDDYATTYLITVSDVHTKQILLYNLQSDTEAFAQYIKEQHIAPADVLTYVDRLRSAGCGISYRTDILIEVINMFIPCFTAMVTDMVNKSKKRRSRSRSPAGKN